MITVHDVCARVLACLLALVRSPRFVRSLISSRARSFKFNQIDDDDDDVVVIWTHLISSIQFSLSNFIVTPKEKEDVISFLS